MSHRRTFLRQCSLALSLGCFGKMIRNVVANASTPEMVLQSRRLITPSVIDKNVNFIRPKKFAMTNNLRRKPGSPFIAKGIFLSLEGYLTDVVDVPLENAVIKIWQTNHLGYYNHLVDINDRERYDGDFVSCGMCRTDNLGYYSFITIMPGYYGDQAPHVNFRIERDGFKVFETKMFFPNHQLNLRDQQYLKLSDLERSLLTCKLKSLYKESARKDVVALFNIKLDGFHPYKRY